MSDLAALLHAEWDRRLCELSEPGVPCPDCIESATHLEAAGVRVADPAAPLREALEIIAADPGNAPDAIGITARNVARAALRLATPAHKEPS